jgi:hypothetical protein
VTESPLKDIEILTMFNYTRGRTSKFLFGLGVIVTTQLGLMTPSLGQYQGNEGDIVVIGDSPADWARFRSYWLDLLQISSPDPVSAESDSTTTAAASEPTTEELEAQLTKNLAVSGLKFQSIRGLAGSSQVLGTLINKNKQPVTVTSVSFEIVNSKGELVQSGSATPEPSTLNPGQSVTFSKDYLGLPANKTHTVKLTPSPFVVRGGV